MRHTLATASLLLASTVLTVEAQAAPVTLTGFASLPANTFSDGPTTGQFAGPGQFGNSLPLIDKQAVQGFSAILAGPTAGSYYVMPDNGFGTKANSADALLRVYAVQPDFRTATGGSGTVAPVDYRNGTALPGFTAASHITLRDPDHKLGFPIVADQATYYNNPANPAVAADIKTQRLLTGADFDIESMRRDHNGNMWFGEEFGPFVVKTDATGKVLAREIALPGVQSPDNPFLAGGTPNLGSSRGFEGMAVNKAGTKLYALLEGTVTGDPAKTLRINEFDVDTEKFTGKTFVYKLDAGGTNIGDMTAINDHEFLVLERNGSTQANDPAAFKKVFKIDLDDIQPDGTVKKTEIADLLHVADPNDLNQDGDTNFAFPFVTIESILPLDPYTLLIDNDNNYPGGGSRGPVSDPNEFITLHLDTPLAFDVPEPASFALLLGGLGLLAVRRRSQ